MKRLSSAKSAKSSKSLLFPIRVLVVRMAMGNCLVKTHFYRKSIGALSLVSVKFVIYNSMHFESLFEILLKHFMLKASVLFVIFAFRVQVSHS